VSVAEVKLIASELGDGESVREVCPFCQGGSSGERSLNVSVRDGAILWNCHRASCLEKGGAGSGKLVRTSEGPRKARVTPYEGALEYLSEDWQDYLAKRIGWDAWHLREGHPMFAPDEERVAFPIYSPMGVRRGWVLRSYQPFAKYKTLTRMDVEEPHLSYYRPNNTPHVVVVEDIPSAVRAARYADAVALCGGGCSPEYAMEIAEHYPNVTWALDNDATSTAMRLCKQHSILFKGQSRVLVLERDLKDEKEERLCQMLK
jgi:hypothetical protein